MSASPVGAWNDLTERERDVLTLLARGMTNEAIAATLYVSTKTVEAACRSLFAKLGLTQSRARQNPRVTAALLFHGCLA